jgi:hypothetical protein
MSNVGRLLGPQVACDQALPIGAAFVTRYSMSDGRLFPIEIITAAIFAILIYSAFLQN